MGHANWYSKLTEIFKVFSTITILPDNFLCNGKEVDSIYLSTKEMRYTLSKENYFEAINDSEINPILRTYKKFKIKAGCEPYLLMPLQYKIRRIISRTRASSHNLGIEIGRHTRPRPTPIEERICTYCSSNSIDDEFHFILNCDKNKYERQSLLSNLSPHISNLDPDSLFVYLFNNNVNQSDKSAAKFKSVNA